MEMIRAQPPNPPVGACPARDSRPGHHALRKGRASIPNGIYLVTTTTLERKKLFADFAVGCAAARCFENTELLGDAKMLAWVLMPDHAHWLLQLSERDALRRVVSRLKSASARHANRIRNSSGTVWARAFHDHGLRHEEDLQDMARYVVANPLRAGLVSRIGIIRSGMRFGCNNYLVACRARSYRKALSAGACHARDQPFKFIK